MPTRDLHEELDDFLTYLEAGRLSRNTMNAYRAAVSGFIERLGIDATPKDLKRQAVRAWLATFHQRHYEPSTIRVRLVALKEFCKFLEVENCGTFDWLFAMRAPKMRHKLPNVPSQQRVRAVLDGDFHKGQQPKWLSPFPERDHAIWELLYCGLRAQEMVNINVEDLRDHCRLLLVHGKGNKERLVPLSLGAIEAVRAYLPIREKTLAKLGLITAAFAFSVGQKGSTDGRLCVRHVWRIVHDIAAKKGLEGFHPHLLRHACGTHLHENGVQLQDIADLLGHSKLGTAAIYTQTALDQRLLKAYRKAFAG
jgi:site-specific recombinase XerD